MAHAGDQKTWQVDPHLPLAGNPTHYRQPTYKQYNNCLPQCAGRQPEHHTHRQHGPGPSKKKLEVTDIRPNYPSVMIDLCICLYLWAVMLRVGRSVVVGHSGGCRCSGDHMLQVRASVWGEWAVARVGTGSLSRVVQQWSTEEIRSVVNCWSCE